MQFISNKLDNFNSFVAVPNKFIVNGDWKTYLKSQKIQTYYPTYKKARLKELDRLCAYHKQGQKIIIDEIYDTPKEKIDGRGNDGHSTSNYNEVDILLYNMLSNIKTDNTICITLNNFLINLSLVNAYNWKLKSNIEKLSAYYNVNIETITDLISNTTIRAKSIVESALNRLVKKNVIEYKLSYMLVKTNANGTKQYELADELQEIEIQDISNNVLNILECKDVKECYLKNNIRDYYRMLNEKVEENRLANSIFKTYCITVKKQINKDTNVDINELKKSLNNKFVNSCIKALNSRVNNAFKKDATNNIYVKNKQSSDYTINTNMLINVIVNMCNESVVEEVLSCKERYITVKEQIQINNTSNKKSNNIIFNAFKNKDDYSNNYDDSSYSNDYNSYYDDNIEDGYNEVMNRFNFQSYKQNKEQTEKEKEKQIDSIIDDINCTADIQATEKRADEKREQESCPISILMLKDKEKYFKNCCNKTEKIDDLTDIVDYLCS